MNTFTKSCSNKLDKLKLFRKIVLSMEMIWTISLPTHLTSLLVVVSLLSNPSEAGSTKTVELQAKLFPFAVGHDVNVRLLSCVQKKKKQF